MVIMGNNKPNAVVDLSFQFGLAIINFTEELETKRKYNMANQLFRSGTSIGANISEAQCAESRKDFIHKIKVAAKEANEMLFWLQLCKHSKNYPDCDGLLTMVDGIIKLTSKIIDTSIENKQS